jgi:hypothetical protein
VEPAVANRLRGAFGIIVVAGHHGVATGDDFADHPAVVRNFPAVVVGHADFARSHELNSLASFDVGALPMF